MASIQSPGCTCTAMHFCMRLPPHGTASLQFHLTAHHCNSFLWCRRENSFAGCESFAPEVSLPAGHSVQTRATESVLLSTAFIGQARLHSLLGSTPCCLHPASRYFISYHSWCVRALPPAQVSYASVRARFTAGHTLFINSASTLPARTRPTLHVCATVR